MHNRPTEAHKKTKVSSKSTVQSTPDQPIQHGKLCILLDLPTESLTHITSFLDPPSLLILSRVSKSLLRHVEDDNTWCRAFAYHYFGIAPESDICHVNTLVPRRVKITWRSEFIFRYEIARRWEWSRNGTITHIPRNSPISSIHLMPSHALLTSYVQSGLVSRSFLLTGKILRDSLNPSDTPIAIRNLNPDLPLNVSTCALTSDGGTAHIAWGLLTGEVAVTTASKVMDSGGRVGAKLVRCRVEDQHDGPVVDAVWGKQDGRKHLPTVVTGGADGKVKLWHAKRLTCLWTSDTVSGVLVSDPCVKVAFEKDIVVGAMQSGDIILWSGFASLLSNEESIPAVDEIPVSCPLHGDSTHAPTTLHIDYTSTVVAVLVSYEDHPHFYRMQFDMTTREVEVSPFGDATFGSITAILPCFSRSSKEPSLVIAGDQMGCVSMYDWRSPSGELPLRKFEANSDNSSVSALAWNGVVLVVGSSLGTISVWHALTFERLREFAVPRRNTGEDGEGGIKQILLGPESEMFVAAAGDQIMTWQVGEIQRRRAGAKRNAAVKRGKKGQAAAAKYHRMQELKETICQSRLEQEEERKYLARARGREKEQRALLESLGLSETEAIQYLLMVSRDEAEQEEKKDENTQVQDDDVSESGFDQLTASAAALASSSTSFLQPLPSTSSEDVQMSLLSALDDVKSINTDDVSHFPPVGPGLLGRSPESVESVWRTRRVVTAPSSRPLVWGARKVV